MRRVLFLCFALVLVTATEARAGYFPTRPQNATMYTVTGVLTWYFVGNGAAAIRVRDQAGKERDIYSARTRSINGITIRCGWPGGCSYTVGPSNVIVGTTAVKIIIR